MLGSCLAEALGDKAGDPALRVDAAAARRGADRGGARPLRASRTWPTRSSSPRTRRDWARRPSTRSWPRSSGAPSPPPPTSPCTSAAWRERTRTTCWRPASRASPAACATRCASRGVASPRPRAACDGRPRIAVLDYGIGNLRSAEKALQHVGAAARLVDRRGRRGGGRRRRAAGCAARSAPARGRSPTAAWRSPPAPPWRPACPSSGSAWGSSCSTRARSRAPGVPGLGIFPGTVGPLPPGGQAPADAVEHAGGRAAPLAGTVARAGRAALGLLRALVRAAGRGGDRGRSATTAARSPRWRPAARCGGPSSTRRSRADGAGAPGQLRAASPRRRS